MNGQEKISSLLINLLAILSLELESIAWIKAEENSITSSLEVLKTVCVVYEFSD